MRRQRNASSRARRCTAAAAVTVMVGASALVGASPAAASLTAIDASTFTLSADYTRYDPLYSALDGRLGNASVDAVMKEAVQERRALDGVTLPGLAGGFRFTQPDTDDCRSYPQGISTSRDAVGQTQGGNYDGHQLVMVSWYTKTDCSGSGARSRITLVDWDADWANTYRKILLVEPTGTAAAPSFRDVNVHAGGIAWYGDLLYVADTSHGLRVFDLRKMLRTDPAGDEALIGRQSDGSFRAHNYSYVLPQIGTITDTGSGDPLLWSTISLDRSNPSIVVAEYTCATRTTTGACASPPLRTTRAVRFPFAASSTRFAATTTASQAFRTSYYKVNGVASHGGRWWFASSGDKKLYYDVPGRTTVAHDWVSYCESISYWEDADAPDQLWSLREDAGNRYVFAVDQASYTT